LITGNFEYNWLYWIAPIIGGIIAAGLYKGLNRDTDFPSAAGEDEQVKQG
jgi:Major intrinsic protein